MDREQIFQRVVESAERFGPRNPQEFRLLESQLSKCSAEEIFYGLLFVFSRSEVGVPNFSRQELAGRLLEKLNPNYKFELSTALRSVIEAFNPSVEQLPMHFARVYGKEKLLNELSYIEREPTTERAQVGIETIRWWLSCSKS